MRPKTPLVIVFLLIGTAQAGPVISPQLPTVVYEGRSTISALPYYQRLKRNVGTTGVAAPEGVLALADRLPLAPTELHVGPPLMKAVPGLITPLFIMGMDEVSLTWFRDAAEGLVDIGARGIVVQASNRSAWIDLQGKAREVGIDLMLLGGDAIARGYGISTYPMVLVNPEREGADE